MSYLDEMEDPPVPKLVSTVPISKRPNTYVAGAAPLVKRTVTLSLTAEDWYDINSLMWKRLTNEEILLSLIVASRLAADREEGGILGNAERS